MSRSARGIVVGATSVALAAGALVSTAPAQGSVVGAGAFPAPVVAPTAASIAPAAIAAAALTRPTTSLTAAKAPAVVVVGQRVTVPITVGKLKKKARSITVRVLLSTSATSPGTQIGRLVVTKVKAKRARVVSISGTVPTLSSAPRGFLIACLRVGKAREGCAAVRRVGVSVDPSASAKVEAALSGGSISRSTAIRIVAGILAGRTAQVPPEFRNPATLADDRVSGLFRDLYETASAADRRVMLPYQLPPTTVGSAYAKKTVATARARSAATTEVPAASADQACRNFTELQQRGWSRATAAGGAVNLFYDDGVAKQSWAYARVLAAQAAITNTIWPSFQQFFRVPVSDANQSCAHGPDGGLDIYISLDVDGGGGAFTMNYPTDVACIVDPHPAWIAFDPVVLTPVALAHEMFHAVQFAYGYGKCAAAGLWFDESTAVWAEEWLYPFNRFTLDERGYALGQGAGVRAGYNGWLFWRYLTHEYGGSARLRDVLLALESAKAATEKAVLAAMDTAIPGGLKQRTSDFGIRAWNQSPIGADDAFPVRESFAQWLVAVRAPRPYPRNAPAVRLFLPGTREATANLAFPDGTWSVLGFGSRIYHDVTIPFDNVRELRWTNEWFGRKALDSIAYLQLRDGTWRKEDWSSRKTVTLCRDNADQDVTRILIATTSIDFAGLSYLPGPKAATIRIRDACDPPRYRVLAASIDQTSALTWPSDPLCGSFTGTQHRLGSVGAQPDNPQNALTVSATGGFMRPVVSVAVNNTAQVGGCAIGVGEIPFPRCTIDHDYRSSWPLDLSVRTTPGSPTATVTWRPIPAEVAFRDGQGVGDISSGCYFPGAFTVTPDRALATTTIATSTLLGDEAFTLSGTGTFTTDTTPEPLAYSVTSAWTYTLTLQRIPNA